MGYKQNIKEMIPPKYNLVQQWEYWAYLLEFRWLKRSSNTKKPIPGYVMIQKCYIPRAPYIICMQLTNQSVSLLWQLFLLM